MPIATFNVDVYLAVYPLSVDVPFYNSWRAVNIVITLLETFLEKRSPCIICCGRDFVDIFYVSGSLT